MSIGSGHVAGPVFKETKSSSNKRKSRIIYSNPHSSSTNAANNEDVLSARSYIARLEVQIEESKRSLSLLCDEMIAYLPAEKELDDYNLELIDQISRTTTVCRMLISENKRINVDKQKALEDSVALQNEFHTRLKEMEEMLTATIQNRDQLARNHATDTRQLREELQQLRKEKEIHRLNTICFENEIETLKTKLDKMETKLLTMPRVEEQILKKAKQEISRKELSLNKREYKWKRLEAEVGDIKTWKDKADHLDATVLILRKQLEEQEKQSRLALRMYQREMAVSTAQIRSLQINSPNPGQQGQSISDANLLQGVASTATPASRPRPKSALPSSGVSTDIISSRPPLPSTQVTDRSHTNHASSAAAQQSGIITNRSGSPTPGINRMPSNETDFNAKANASMVSTKAGSSSVKTKEKDMNVTFLEAKVSKLETENAFLGKKVKQLAKALSNARAYPLLTTIDNGPYTNVTHPPLQASATGDGSGGPQLTSRIQKLEEQLTKEDKEAQKEEEELRRRLLESGEITNSESDTASNASSSYDLDDGTSTSSQEQKTQRAPGEAQPQKSMDQVREENHKRLQKMMLAIHGPKAKRLTFSPSAHHHHLGDDDDHDYFDPQWQKQERQYKEERQARKANLADDLRNRIDSNRKSRPQSADAKVAIRPSQS